MLTADYKCENCLEPNQKQLNWSKESHKWLCVTCERKEYKIQDKEPLDLKYTRNATGGQITPN